MGSRRPHLGLSRRAPESRQTRRVPYAQIDEGIELYYELTGPDDGPVVIQFGGGLFGRHNFGFVNDGFREAGFRLLSFDARGYGASTSPREWYTIEGWAADGAKLLDALELERVLVHGTSMGGMIAIAFAANHGDRVIATCADVAFAKPDVYRATLFRVWRRMAESMPWDDFSDHVTTQAVGAALPRERGGQGHVRDRPLGDRRQRPLHGAPGLSRDGADGSLAARAEDRATAADDERHPRHPLPAGARALRSRRAQMAELNPVISTHEFPDIGHADLLECPADAVRIVGEFFRRHL